MRLIAIVVASVHAVDYVLKWDQMETMAVLLQEDLRIAAAERLCLAITEAILIRT